MKNAERMIVGKGHRHGLNCVPLNLYVPQYVTVFGDSGFKDVIKLKWGTWGGS